MESLKNISQLQLLNLIFKRKDFLRYLVWYLYNGILNKKRYRERIGEIIRDIERFRKCTVFMCHGTTLEKDIAAQVLQVITSPDSIFTMLIKYQRFTRRISKQCLLKYLESIVLKNFYDEIGCLRINVDNSETLQHIVCCNSLNNEERFPFFCMLDNLACNVVHCDSIANLSLAQKFQAAAICNSAFVVNHLWSTASEDDKKTLLGESKETIALQLASVIGMEDILRWFLERDVGVNCSEPQERNTLLHIAARAGNVGSIAMLLDKGAYVNALNSSLETPIHAAAAGGCIDALTLIWNNNTEFEPRCKDGNTPLHNAVDKGHIGLVNFLLENGANVNVINNQSTTPLHIAAIRGNLALVDLLLRKGADKDALDCFNQTPLLKACFRDHSSVVKLLLKKWGAQLHSQMFPNGTTELHVTATKGHFKSSSILLECNADPSTRDAKGKTPLHFAAGHGFYAIAKLLSKCANVFAEDDSHKIAIHEACSKGHQEIVQLLVSTQSDAKKLINFPDKKGSTPLHYACRYGSKFVVEYLLGCRGIQYSSDEHGRTILHEAAWNDQEEIVKLILRIHPNKADIIDMQDHRGVTAVQLAINHNHVNVVKLLESNGASIPATRRIPRERSVVKEINGNMDINTKNELGETQLHFAVRMRDVDAVKSVLKQKGLKVNLKDLKQATALHLAIKINCLQIVALLVTVGNIDFNATDEDGNTPLHCAVLGQNVETLCLLFRGDVIKKVKVNPRNKSNETPLHIAAKSENVEILRMLLKRKVDFDAKNSTDQTALQMAVQNGNVEIVQCLLENKDDAYTRGKNGEAILHVAIKEKREDLTKWILEKYPDQVNSQNCNGNSGLHFAVMSKSLAILEAVLMTHGVMVNLRNNKQETPLLLLARHWTKMPEDVISCLLEHPDIDLHAKLPNGRNALHLFAMIKSSENGNCMHFDESNSSSVKYDSIKSKLISNKFSNVADHDGNTATHLSALTGNKELLKFLHDCDNVGINFENNAGETALHLACREGYIDSVSQLLKHPLIRIDGEMKDYPWTPLALALNGKHWEIVRLLLLNGAKVNIEIDSYGRSPLHFLTAEKKFSLVEVLLERYKLPEGHIKWLNIRAIDGFGKTALDYAKEYQCLDIERLIIRTMNVN